MTNLKWSFFLLLIIFFATATDVLACSCSAPTACEAFNRSKAIFIGRAIKGSQQRDRLFGGKTQVEFVGEVVFEVIEPFSGVSDRFIKVKSPVNQLCGYHSFIQGTPYLVYASEWSDKELFTSICSRTRLLDTLWLDSLIYGNDGADSYRKNMAEKKREYEEEIVFLRNVAQGKINGARIYGSVSVPPNYLIRKENRPPDEYLSGVKITVEGEQQSIVSQTDSHGQFDLQNLKPGTYSVTLTVPDGYTSDGERERKREFVLRNCGCGNVEFQLRPDTSIRGHVFDENGKPIAAITVNLISADWQNENDSEPVIRSYDVRESATYLSGEYVFEKVAKGRYLLGVSIAYPDTKFPYSRLFYPGTEDIKKAEPIVIEIGKKVGPFDLHLSKKLPTQMIEGVVLWPDDKPAVGAKVRMQMFGNYRSQFEAKTDEKGRFTLNAVSGRDYEIEAYWEEDEGENEDEKDSGEMKVSPLGWRVAVSESERITATKDAKSLKLVLTKRQN